MDPYQNPENGYTVARLVAERTDALWVMTRGGPEDATISIAMFLYVEGFKFLNMGYASAVAWVLFLIIFALTVLNWRLRGRWVHEG